MCDRDDKKLSQKAEEWLTFNQLFNLYFQALPFDKIDNFYQRNRSRLLLLFLCFYQSISASAIHVNHWITKY